ERDLVIAADDARVQDVAQLGHFLTGDQAGVDGVRQLSAGARLLPLVAEEAAAPDRLELDLLLAVGVGAEHRDVLAGAQIACQDPGSVPGRPGAPDLRGGSPAATPAPPAELTRERLSRLGTHVGTDTRAVACGREAASRPGAVHSGAD